MMNIAVVASNGKASRAIIEELVARGHEVTAFARHENQSAADCVLIVPARHALRIAIP